MIRFVLFIALVLIALFFMCNSLAYLQCEGSWENSGYRYRYNVAGGCMVEIEGHWITADAVRVSP